MTSLGSNPRVVQLARDLRLPTVGDCLEHLEKHALDHVWRIVKASPVAVTSLNCLRDLIADALSVNLRFIRSDEDISTIAEEFSASFPGLEITLNGEFLAGDTEGLLLPNPTPEPWERKYLAIIDARGARVSRAWFTSWHELTHLLVTPAQLSLQGLRRSPAEHEIRKDPVEQLVDHVAGQIAFWTPLFQPALDEQHSSRRDLEFADVERARLAAAPEASLFATAMAAIRLVRTPTLLVGVELALKAEERRRSSPQISFGFENMTPAATPKQRIVQCVPNAAARRSNLEIFRNMRVPISSVLHRVSQAVLDVDAAAYEDQSWWETSSGGNLAPLPLHVRATRRGSHVYGLISPLSRPLH